MYNKQVYNNKVGKYHQALVQHNSQRNGRKLLTIKRDQELKQHVSRQLKQDNNKIVNVAKMVI